MGNRDVCGALVQTFQREGIPDEGRPCFLRLVGVGSELTGIEGKSLAAALALIPLLPPGESALDKVGVSRTAAGAAFGSSVLNLSIEVEIFHCDPTEPLHLLLAQPADHVHQFVSCHRNHSVCVDGSIILGKLSHISDGVQVV